MSTIKPPYVVPWWLRRVGLVVAGALSFALAASFQVWRSGNTSDDNNIVQPVARTQPAIGNQRDVPLKLLQHEPVDLPNTRHTQPTGVAIRMPGLVTFNPFGPLNMAANLDADDKLTLPRAAAIASLPSKQPSRTVPPESVPLPVQAVMTPAPAPLPVPPTAPPLPFTVAGAIQGALVAEGQRVAFLRQRDEVLVVRAGDAIGRSYRVDTITPEKIEFTYLPLNQRQSLSLAP